MRRLSPERWGVLEPLLDRTLDLAPEERRFFLDAACTSGEISHEDAAWLAAECDRSDAMLGRSALERFSSLLTFDSPDARTILSATLGHRYRVEGELGAGGMATVYRAFDLEHQRNVAIKVLRAELTAALGAARFHREIEVTTSLDHPCIVPLLESGEASGRLYYVMPHVEGETLRTRIRREHSLPIETALKITLEIASALDYAHERGIVHRDLKPENILLDGDAPRLVDFGIARAMLIAGGDRLTETGVAIGTPAYMSPEQASGETDVDGRSDLYSLGCVLYEMLAGEPPFSAPSSHALMAKHRGSPPPRISVVRDAVPEHVERLLLSALAKVPTDRPQTASSFAKALSRADSSETSERVTWPRVQRHRVAGLAMLVAALVGATTALVWRPWQTRTGPADAYRIAVFPFAVNAGADLDYLGEASMDYLSSAIDGVGELRRADPLSLIVRLRRDGAARERIAPERARDISASVHAGRYVLGTVHEVAGRIRISGSLYDASAGVEPVASASAEGSSRELPAVTTALARDLFADQPIGRGARLSSIASIRAASHEAERAYVEGEALLRRAQYDSAAAAFRRAVRVDSTFALAWYRLGYAEDFRGPPGAGMIPAIDAAMRHLDRLSDRDQLLAKAFYAYAHGDAKRTDEQALRAVSQYPDQVEGLWLLGINRLAKSWMFGRSAADAREPLVRALAIDPSHPLVLYQMVWLAAYERRYAELDSLVRASRLRARDHRITHGPFAHVILAFAGDDAAAQHAWLQRIRTDPFGLHLGLAAAYHTDNMLGARRMLRVLSESPNRTEADRAQARWELGHFEYGAGRRRAAATEFRQASSASAERLVDYVLLSVLPIIGLPTSELRILRDSLRDWVPSLPRDLQEESGGYLRWYRKGDGGEYFSGAVGREAALLRPYLVGLLSARIGDADLARTYAEQLETAGVPSDSAALWSDLALEIRALIEEQAGRTHDALSTLERARMTTRSHYQFLRVLYRRPIGRFLRAEMLFRLGRYEEAIRFYEPATAGSVLNLALLAPSTLRIAQSYDRLGQRGKAVEYYSRFIARWSDCDPELRPLADDARQRVARLTQ